MKAIKAILTFVLLSAVAVFVYYVFDYQQKETKQTIRTYSVENADKKAKLIAVRLENRLAIAQANVEPVAQFLSKNSIWNNDFTHILREVVENRNSGINSIVFAVNPLHLKRAPYYFWSGDTLHFKDLANDNYWEKSWYKNTLTSGNIRWTSERYSGDRLEVFYSQQIKTSDGEFLKGVLKVSVLIADIFKENEDASTLFYLITDQKIADQNVPVFFCTKEKIEVLEKKYKDFDKILQKESNPQAYIEGNVPFYIAFAPVSAADWTVAVLIQNDEIPASSIGAFVKEHKNMLIIGAIIFVFVLMLLAFFISRKGNHIDHRRIQNRMNVGR